MHVHDDKENKHVYIYLPRTDYNDKTINDKHSMYRAINSTDEIAKNNLTRAKYGIFRHIWNKKWFRFWAREKKYQAVNCTNCPLKRAYHQSTGNRIIQVNEILNRHKEIAHELLNSEEGIAKR